MQRIGRHDPIEDRLSFASSMSARCVKRELAEPSGRNPPDARLFCQIFTESRTHQVEAVKTWMCDCCPEPLQQRRHVYRMSCGRLPQGAEALLDIVHGQFGQFQDLDAVTLNQKCIAPVRRYIDNLTSMGPDAATAFNSPSSGVPQKWRKPVCDCISLDSDIRRPL